MFGGPALNKNMKALILILVFFNFSIAEDIPQEYRDTVRKGLEWMVQQQSRDGHWEANGQYPITMTALGGMSLLMQGSTIREGKYKENISKYLQINF